MMELDLFYGNLLIRIENDLFTVFMLHFIM